MPSRFVGSALQYPARAAFLCYVLLIALGTVVLSRPGCWAAGRPAISGLDAAFTATSAVCVTGLTVRSTAHDFSLAGQLVILALIQLGGIGIMTVTTFAMLELGSRATIRQRALLAETLGSRPADDLRWVLRNVLWIVLVCEGAGFLVLAVRNLFDFAPLTALWYALFHTVSAFCNAGFALFDDSLIRYRADPVVNITMMSLIIIGGIGFPVIIDLRRQWSGPARAMWTNLTLHTKLVLIGTAVLLVLGAGSFLILERDNALKGLPGGQRLLVAMFHSTTTRTAGFNTVETASLTNATLFVTILLMLIGASPCSTGGGFKVSTLVVLVLLAWSKFRGSRRVILFRRGVSQATIDRALATVLSFAAVGALVLTLLLAFEQSRLPHTSSRGMFLEALFESASALGTVGLSMGMTSMLSQAGRVLIILLMFAGRLGPISVFVAVARAQRRDVIDYPKEDVLIG